MLEKITKDSNFEMHFYIFLGTSIVNIFLRYCNLKTLKRNFQELRYNIILYAQSYKKVHQKSKDSIFQD